VFIRVIRGCSSSLLGGSKEYATMYPAILLLAGLSLSAEGKPDLLHYIRPQGMRFVPESEATRLASPGRPGTYTSKTTRGQSTTTLTIHFDKKGRVSKASVKQTRGPKEKPTNVRTVTLEVQGQKGKIRQGDKVVEVAVPRNPIVTTAPDWSDIFQLVQRYDQDQGGKQVFAGLWIHPTRNHLELTFTIEPQGTDVVMVKDKKETLTRYLIHLRSGNYRVWATRDRRVCKILSGGARAVPVVLKGYEETTRELK
jgi:hypothetical protein